LATIGDAGRRAASSRYDAFLSYSHAADGLLAPRLQAGLQRFAKPWWKRRAVRVFRDQSSLSANPHLWSSIIEALDASAWFVLLLSKEAADSKWVNREVEYWVAHKDVSRLLPVVTDGEFEWEEGEVSAASTAAPPALSGVFSEEPRWVDLRWARSDEHLDLSDPRFSDAVADIASAIRGVPKDDLASEEVRQHRRTVRTALAAAVVLLLFGIAATIGAVVAVDKTNEARAQQRAAEDARVDAEAAQALAENERDRANTEADRANRVSAHLIDVFVQPALSDAPRPGPDVLSGDRDDPPTPLAVVPATARLDFFLQYCESTTCFRDAQLVYPDGRTIAGWHPYEPFHIRHGFVNGEEAPLPLDRPGSPGYDLRVFVTRRFGPVLADASFPLDQTFRFHVDYLVREISDQCGTDYALGERTEPQPCEMFMHDFPEGLPPGRYDFWVEWRAPCLVWLGDEDLCSGITVPLDLVVSQVNIPFGDY
jgi:TIR domain